MEKLKIISVEYDEANYGEPEMERLEERYNEWITEAKNIKVTERKFIERENSFNIFVFYYIEN